MDAVRNALHHPISIIHRDIKTDNLLVHPQTLHLVVLDFGLATHFSSKEPKLSTCCGSPAYHSPELWLSLRSPPGSIRYFGPEVDVWCCGITLLRCLTGQRCPIGTAHASLSEMRQKIADALLSLCDSPIRATVADFLSFDSSKRLQAFRNYTLSTKQTHHIDATVRDKPLKSTSFIPIPPRYTLNLPLQSPSVPSVSPAPLFRENQDLCLRLSNPDCHSIKPVVSYIKYCLRSAGILYHQWPADQQDPLSNSLANHPVTVSLAHSSSFSKTYLHCVMPVSDEETSPPRTSHRGSTIRSSSTPPTRQRDDRQQHVRGFEFFASIEPDGPVESPSLVIVKLSDHRAQRVFQQALDFSRHDQAIKLEQTSKLARSNVCDLVIEQEERSRGRQPTSGTPAPPSETKRSLSTDVSDLRSAQCRLG